MTKVRRLRRFDPIYRNSPIESHIGKFWYLTPIRRKRRNS